MTAEELHQLSHLLNKFIKEYHPPSDSKLYPDYKDKIQDRERDKIIYTRYMVAEKQMDKVNESNK